MRDSLLNLFLSGCLLILASCNSLSVHHPVVTVTLAPQATFARALAGERFTIHTMVPTGFSPESFDPPASALVALSQSSAYFQIGSIGFERAWMDKLREHAPKMQVFDNSKGITFLEQTHICHHEGHTHDHGMQDPHIWTTPKLMKQIVRNMSEAFCSLDTAHQMHYLQRKDSLIREFERLEDQLTTLLQPHRGETFVIYHPSLTYFAHEYGLHQLTIELNGKEPSVANLKTLVDEVRESKAKVIFIQQEFDQKHAKALAQELDLKIVPINPLSENWEEEMIKIAHAFDEK